MLYEERLPEPVLTANRYLPSWLISTQQVAVWPLRAGAPVTEDSRPPRSTRNAETLPLPGPAWALLTKSWPGSVGRNCAPIGPRSSAG